MNSIIIAGTHSGVGKTTISIGIMAALRARGLSVQPFKAGPDFIDPGYHTFVTGRTSRNLDGWLMGEDSVREVFERVGNDADICVVEGAMGLFDGIGASGLEGSAAQVAVITGSPVILVIDARSMAGSVAAVVKGFETLNPDVKIAGLILNRVGSSRHEQLLRQAIKLHCKAEVVGVVPRDEGLDIPSRHLGLTTDVAGILKPKFMKKLMDVINASIDLDRLIKIAGRIKKPVGIIHRPVEVKKTARLAVAMDEAFCFYYPENLELLESFGIEIVPFSPLKDDGLPENIRGIYIGGGYPEMYARGLSFNDFIKHDIKAAAASGIPIYAECGGLMYLTQGITDHDGVFYPMCGVLPTKARMLDKKKALGYREVKVTSGSTIFPRGAKARGHEFHYSEIEPMGAGVGTVYDMKKGGSKEITLEGFAMNGLLASYVHLHFMSNPAFAKRFAEIIKKVQAPYSRA